MEPISVEARQSAIDSAIQHLDAGRTVEALAITNKLIQRDPNSLASLETHAVVLLGETMRLISIGNESQANILKNEALETYLSICQFEKVTPHIQFSTAQLAHELGEYQLAQSLYKKSHAALVNDGRPALWLAQIELLEENWVSANNWIQESLQRQPLEPFTLISAGLIQANLQQCEEAMSYTNKAIGLKPNDENFRFMQARILRICGNPERALELLTSLSSTAKVTPLVIDEIASCKERIKEVNNVN
jgi:tetratricopeptide (TPR) repeat protein